MPGYRRTRKYARKTYRRKKIYRRKRMMGRKARADKGHLEKLTKVYPLTIDAGGTFAHFGVNWLATGASGQLNGYFTGGNANLDPQF